MTQLHEILDLSFAKRVFIVGDIHGEYPMLEAKLKEVGFDSTTDVLISVGDLADRGPESEQALEWIKHPWFKRILGNHDIAPRLFLQGNISTLDIIQGFGGGWFVHRSEPEIEAIARQLEDAAVALTVITPAGHKVGIIHADVSSDWDKHITSLDLPHVYDYSLWNRQHINAIKYDLEQDVESDPAEFFVSGIDHVFHGHTPMPEPVHIANRSWIDTGACYGGYLTIIDIDEFLTQTKK